MKRLLIAVLSSTVLCGGSMLWQLPGSANSFDSVASINSESNSTIIINGVKTEIRVRGNGSNSVQQRTDEFGNQFTIIKSGSNVILIKNGRVYRNGRDRGSIQPGASILVDERGQLFVNGKQR